MLIGTPDADAGRFVDAFSGTGVVASKAADLGWNVHVNDHLYCARLLSNARMLATSDVSYDALGGYCGAITSLNAVESVAGFLRREYSPASIEHAPRPRRYFTEENAGRLDGMRALIREWRKMSMISSTEEELLLADLIEAASSVANTAGTFGCFLSEWSRTSLQPVQLRARDLRQSSVQYTVGGLDVFSVQTKAEDTVYLDPPYTKRQYAAYYHVLETIAFGDEPQVSGVTGLRPWRDKASLFCYKRHALPTILKLVKHIRAERILISYSAEGHIDIEELASALKQWGTVKIHSIREISRYQPNGSAPQGVNEYVIEFQRGTSLA